MPNSNGRSMLGFVLSRLRRRAKAFGRDSKGATAVEFALLALPFFTIIFAILETAIVFLASQVLETAVEDSTRLLRTGQAQSYSAANYRTAICDRLFSMFNCAQLKIKVSVVNSFASATVTPPLDPSTGNWTMAEAFAPGASSSILLVQAYYKWPTLIDFGGFNLQTQSDGTRLLSAVRVLRNEPY